MNVERQTITLCNVDGIEGLWSLYPATAAGEADRSIHGIGHVEKIAQIQFIRLKLRNLTNADPDDHDKTGSAYEAFEDDIKERLKVIDPEGNTPLGFYYGDVAGPVIFALRGEFRKSDCAELKIAFRFE